MKKNYFPLLMVMFSPLFVLGQYPEWMQFQTPAQTRIFEEQGNYIWAASSGGLYRIDKVTGFSEGFNNANSPLSDNFITALESVGDSVLWIGTLYGGLVKLQDNVWTVYDTTNSPLYFNRITTLDADENGVLWAVGSGIDYEQLGMVARFDGNEWIFFEELWYPIEIHVEDTNFVWIRRGEEVQTLVKFNGQQILEEYYPWEWSTGCLWCFESFDIDIHGNKWIQSDSLVKFDDSTFTKYTAGIPMSYGGMHIDTDTLWFPMPDGYARFANEEWSFYQKPDSIEGPVNVIEVDTEENIWLCIEGEGVYKQSDSIWSAILTGLPFGITTSVAVDEEGNIWAGSHVGLAIYDGTEWTIYDTSNSLLPSEEIMTIAVDGNIVWIGTQYGGLVRIVGDDWTVFNPDNSGLPWHSVFELVTDLDGVLWIGTGEEAGLTSFDGEEWITYTTANSGIPENNVREIEVDQDNNIWISTLIMDDGVPEIITLFDGNNWTNYPLPEEPAGFWNPVLSMAVDTNGALWVITSYWNGTLEDGNWTIHGDESAYVSYIDPEGTRWMAAFGLSRWDSTGWSTFTTTNSGLPSNAVWDLDTDADGTLWIATSTGVAAYNQEGFPVATRHINVADNLKIYPNPAGDYVNILLPANQHITKVQIFDVQGKLYGELKDTSVIPTSDFKNGMYLIEIQTQDGIYRGKMIK